MSLSKDMMTCQSDASESDERSCSTVSPSLNPGFPQISVVVCLYNPDLKKALLTLASIVCQVNVDYEVILADDGSREDLTGALKKYLLESGFEGHVEVLRGDLNQGTVKNIANALEYVRAPFVKLISPGDCLYCDTTLATIVGHLEKTGADLAFGKAVYYSLSPEVEVFDISRPSFPEKYDMERFGRAVALDNILTNWDLVLGVTMSFRTSSFKSAIGSLVGHVKYVEDNTSLVSIMMKGGTTSLIDCFVVWYEYGSGVSTRRDSKWSTAIACDYREFWDVMLSLYPGDRRIERRKRMAQFQIGRKGVSTFRRAVWELTHPFGLLRLARTIVARCRYKCTGYDKSYINAYLESVDERVCRVIGE